MSSASIHGISSMATRQVLAELAADFERRSGTAVRIESVGGVDAARRVREGEAFDVVILASDAIDALIASGHLQPGRIDLVRSPVTVAVRAGAPHPRIDTEDRLRDAVLAARHICYSTGPSGKHLASLFERWGLTAQITAKTVQAPPGVPVGSLVARGDAEIGFQQLSELMHLDGIDVLGTLPPGAQFITTFSAGVGAHSTQGNAVRAMLADMNAPAAAPAKQRHGMQPA